MISKTFVVAGFSFGLLFLFSSYIIAGQVSMTTYYPSPSGNYADVNATNIGVGTITASKINVSTNGLQFKGTGTGYAYIGDSGCGGDYTGLTLNGSQMAGCNNYNILSSKTDTNLFINRPTGKNIYFRENNADHMTILTGGNVGLGLNNPVSKLDIANGHISLDTNFHVGNRDGFNFTQFGDDGNPTYLAGANDVIVNIDSNNTNTGSNFIVGTNRRFDAGGNELFRIQDDGNVGIGIAAPKAALQVANGGNGTLYVNTNIDSTFTNFGTLWGTTNTAPNGLAIGWNKDGGSRNTNFVNIAPGFIPGGFSFDTWDGATLTNRMKIDSTGNLDVTGNATISSRVGIGVAAPTVKLDVAQNSAVRVGQAYFSSGGDYAHVGNNAWYNGGAWVFPGGSGALLQLTGQVAAFYTHNGVAFTQTAIINANGNLGIGVAAPAYKLDVAGDANFSGDLTAQGGFWHSSDERLKKDIAPIDHALYKIARLKGVHFSWKNNDKKSIGVIAQNVEEVFPELVATDKMGMKSVEDANLVAVLIEGMKGQQQQIDDLKEEVRQLKKDK